ILGIHVEDAELLGWTRQGGGEQQIVALEKLRHHPTHAVDGLHGARVLCGGRRCAQLVHQPRDLFERFSKWLLAEPRRVVVNRDAGVAVVEGPKSWPDLI